MPLILPGNVASATASTTYDVDNSCRFFSNTSLHKDNGGSATNRDKYTVSFWYKKCSLVGSQDGHKVIMVSGSGTQGDGSDDYMQAYFKNDDTFRWQEYDSGVYSDELVTTQKFRDPTAWYHFVLRYDSTESTANDRMRIYVNGTQVTSFGTRYNPDQNQDGWFGDDNGGIAIGGVTNQFCNGYLAEVVGVDGQSLAPTEFGKFDEDSPTIWKPKDVSGITLGNNGFYLDFKDSANLGNDANGGTDFTEVNLDATDQATDTPSNNFATLNPLINVNSTANYPTIYSEGNCRHVTSGDWVTTVTTLGAAAGKWYAEIEYDNAVYAGLIGVIGEDAVNTGVDILSNNLGEQTSCVGYKNTSGAVRISGSAATAGSSYTTGDIIQVALDLDNGNVYFGKNDTWQNSGDPESGATGTGAYAIGGPAGQFWFFSCGPYASGASMECNFGGCSAFTVSSGNADANGYGAFEYAVPSGYLALCTKNLGSDGG